MATEASISGTARRHSNLSAVEATEVTLGGTALLIVDPQVDFHEGGSLAVPGAIADAQRIAQLITDHAHSIDDVVVTMDSHHVKLAKAVRQEPGDGESIIDSMGCRTVFHWRLDIAHPQFWTNEKGEHPPPFTMIKSLDVQDKSWVPVQEEHLEHCIDYTRKLEEGQKFTLCVWPEHCLIGTPGHAVHPIINAALQEWTVARKKTVTYVQKGQCTLSEHYSCFAAEVPVAGDEANERGRTLLARLCAQDSVLVCGQASSHCVNFSGRDLANAWKRTTAGAPEADARRRMERLVLLKDGASPVPGFEVEASQFFEDMQALGVGARTCAEVFSS